MIVSQTHNRHRSGFCGKASLITGKDLIVKEQIQVLHEEPEVP